MNKIKVIFVIFLLISSPFLSSYTHGAANADIEKFFPEGFDEQTENELFSSLEIGSVINAILSAFSKNLAEALAFFATIFGLAILIICAETCLPGENSAFSRQISAAAAGISGLAVFAGIYPLYQSISEGITSLTNSFATAIPVFTAILSAGGHLKSAAMGTVNMNLTLVIVNYISGKLLLPLSSAVFALSLLAGIDTGAASLIAKRVKSFFLFLLGLVTTVLLSLFSMQSLIASASDTAYLKAAKYAASGMIPIVGSTVSSALGTFAGGLMYAKSIVGISTVVVMLGIALSPIIKLLLYRLSFTITISFLEFVGADTGKKSFSAFKDSLEILTAVYIMTTLVCVFEVIILTRCGGSI